jgi:two-component system, LytTR family, response regulator
MTLRTLIVDDEAPARRRLRRLLMIEGDVAIVGECGDGTSALAAIATLQPDLVLLDVQMPERDGFAVVQALPPGTMPAILFVTAFDRYALQAFEVHAVDYLLKPFTPERFRTALARARERIAARTGDGQLASLAAALRNRPPAIARVPVRAGSRTLFVDVRSIDWLDAADNYVRLHASGKEYFARETLASLEAQLDPSRFARIHRSAIVQIDRIAELRPTSHGDAEVRLRDGTVLTVSRTWREGLDRALGAIRLTKGGGSSG